VAREPDRTNETGASEQPLLARRGLLLGAAASWLWSGVARADPCPETRLEASLRDIAEARAKVATLVGPFTQERKIGLLAAKVRSTGTMTLVRPDRLRWELAPPDDAVYWILPEGLAYKNKTGQGRFSGGGDRIAAALDDLRILLGGDLARLRERYELRATCDEGPVVYSAVPKPGQVTPAKSISFTLADDLVSPKSTTLIFGPRDQTEIAFGTLHKNVPVDPALMRPPA
jgi:hypothetical protein